jgi:flagella basal body P-ring formation protein FlgA
MLGLLAVSAAAPTAQALTAYVRPEVVLGSDGAALADLTLADLVDFLPASAASVAAGREPVAATLHLAEDAATLLAAESLRAELSALLAGPLVIVGDTLAILPASQPGEAALWFLRDALRMLGARSDGVGTISRLEMRITESAPPLERTTNRDRVRITAVDDNSISYSYQQNGRTRHSAADIQVDRYGVVATARVDIRSGDLLDEELLAYQERVLPQPAAEVFLAGQTLPRLEATRLIRAGDVVARQHLRAIRAVTAGEDVLLRFVRGAVEVTMPGKATQSADLGDTVRARRSGGTEVFVGLAVADGEVLVDL